MSSQKSEATLITHVSILRRERQVRDALLEQAEGEGAPRVITLLRNEILLGRSTDADIHISSQRASRIHASIVRKGQDYQIRDHQSHNGIFLNGVKINSALLRDGDVLQIADALFVFREG
jgi:pSer/pThr/pTyr-binding forkhead associated (FHA) protein